MTMQGFLVFVAGGNRGMDLTFAQAEAAHRAAREVRVATLRRV
jgi:hypothetical protein